MATISEISSIKTTNLQDKEWAEQYNNLTKMLDRYLTPKSETLSTSQDLPTQLTNKPTLMQPIRTDLHSKTSSKIPSHSAQSKIPNIHKKKLSMNPSLTTTNSKHTRSNSTSTFQTLESRPRHQMRSGASVVKKSPPKYLQQQTSKGNLQ